MDIEEVRRLKTKLAADITELVSSFQRETNLTVTLFDIEHYWTDADTIPVSTQIEVKTELLP